MELVTFTIPKSVKKFTICPLGDVQWSGTNGPTAADRLRKHIDKCLEMESYFVGMGDYIDFMSPSNRQRLMNAGLYDTAMDVISEKALELTEQVYEKFLKDTTGRWIGLLEGHHFSQGGGETTDEKLAEMLKTQHIGSSCYVKIHNADSFCFWAHHGQGSGGKLPASGLTTLYHTSNGLRGAKVYLMGHNTKLGATPLCRPFPVWGKKNGGHRLNDEKIYLVNTGGFSKSNIVGHRVGTVKRGDYAELAMYTPSPLSGAFVKVDLNESPDSDFRVRVEV